MTMLDFTLFVAFPYLAIVFAVAIGIFRTARDKTAFSSFSSQILEKEALYAGSATWHYGILIVLIAHGLALVFPRLWRLLGGSPLRLWGMEVTGVALGLMALAGLGILMVRRIVVARVRRVTSAMDWALEIVLLLEVGMGLLVALTYRWGSQWYLSTAVPWVLSLLTLRPDTSFITNLPWLVKLHFFGAFVLVGLFPFGRLLHLATSRLSYLFRPYQVVIWQRRGDRRTVQAETRSASRDRT
jgi:nitrate reductase gamma subunit